MNKRQNSHLNDKTNNLRFTKNPTIFKSFIFINCNLFILHSKFKKNLVCNVTLRVRICNRNPSKTTHHSKIFIKAIHLEYSNLLDKAIFTPNCK